MQSIKKYVNALYEQEDGEFEEIKLNYKNIGKSEK